MSTAIGGWYLNNKGVLQYRLLDGTTQTTTVLASVSGLTNIINGTGTDEGKIMVKHSDGWKELSATDITIVGEEEDTDNEGKYSATSIKIGSDVLGTAKVVIAGSANYTVGALDFIDQNSRVHLKEAETITYNSTAGTATVTGKLTAGFTVNGLTATYSAATAENKPQTLATISGLAKGYSDSTVALGKTSFNTSTGAVTTGTITLSKVSSLEEPAAGTVSALGTTAIKVAMDKTAAANGLNYYLAFGNKTGEDYAQVADNDEAPYWSLNKTTATYQYYSPTGYTLNDTTGKATQVNITPAKTTVVATVTGLAADLTTNVTDGNPVATEVGTGRSRITNEFVAGLTVATTDAGKLKKPEYEEDGKTLKTDADGNVTGKGTVTINVTRSVLPTKGTVTVTAGKDFTVETTTNTTAGTNDFYTKAQADEDDDKEEGEAKVVKDQYIWVISGNKAIYEKVDLAYYEVTTKITDRSGNESDNKDKNGNIITRIICTPQGKPTVLATITGLDADYLENEANLTRNSTDTSGVITHIKGINVALEGTPAVMDGKTVKTAAVPGEIMLSKEVLGTTNASLAKSDNYRLSLATAEDVEDLDDESTAVALPGFKNYKWNLVGTTATLKGTVTAGYTASDDGKLITYTAAGDNQTLATVAGLKKGTQLDKDETEGASYDYRTIGNDINGTFTDGLAIETDSTKTGGSLSHKTGDPGTEKTLVRMPITLSKHVMEGKVTLNSNFFTLAINQENKDTATITDKAASRIYVLTKDELYTASAPDAKGKVTYTENEDAQKLVGWYGALGSTVTLRQNTPPCYELVTDTYGTTKTINYTAASKTAKLLATVTGLNPSVTEDDISFDATNHKITIKNANALTTSNVKITNPAGTADDDMYKLAIDDDATDISGATLSNTTWTQAANGTVSYKADVTSPGYKLNADANTITYTKATTTTAATLATITGLKTGLLDGENTTTPTGVTLNESTGTITLSKSALGTAKVVLSGEANYKLDLATDVVQEKKDDLDRWVISGTNAIFKRVTPDYYTLTDNTITYTAPVDVKYQKTDESDTATYSTTLAGKAIVYGTIQGLKSGLTVKADGTTIGYYNENGAFVEAITVDANKKITISDEGVLNNTTVKLDATAIASGYEIYLDTEAGQGAESLADQLKPEADENTLAWSINRGTATYKGSIGAGYANSDGTAINYSAANTNATIATITGLNTTLTSVGDDDLKFGTGTDDNVITVTADMLGTTDAKLTTNIAILGENYKLALDDNVMTADTVTSKEIWTIDSSNANTTTATYGTWKDTHYTLNEGTQEAPGACDTITYYKAGVAETDKIATVSGLAGNIVTVKDDQINGIDTSTANTITLSSSVLPTTTGSTVELKNLNDNTYKLALNDDEVDVGTIPTPLPNAIGYTVSKGDYATVIITEETSAGFVYGTDTTYDPDDTTQDKTKLVYNASNPTGDKAIGKLVGLSADIEVESDDEQGSKIEGIVVNTAANTITLSEAALSNTDVTLTDSEYTLALDGVPQYTADPSWKSVSVNRGEAPKFELWVGEATAGYEVAEGNKSITYLGGGEGKKAATITGLKNTDSANVKVDTENKQIIISVGALNAQDVSIENVSGYNYALVLNNTNTEATGYVAPSTSTNAWALTNGTATFTQTVTAGYALGTGDDAGKIVYTAPSSIVSTFTNFSKEATILDQDDVNTLAISQDTTANPATYKGITFAAGDSGKGTFTISDANLLAHKNVKLTTKATGTTADYTIVLGSGVAADVAAPVWNKAENATVATYTQTTAAGYSLDSTSKNIVYSSDPTTVTLATVSGLNKESVVGTITTGSTTTPAIGIETVTNESTAPVTTTFTAGLVVDKEPEGTDPGEITISGNVLNNAKVALGRSDNYKFVLDETANNAVPQSDVAETQVWTQNRTAATYKNVKPAYYGLDATEKTVNYTPQADANVEGTSSPNIVTISGLKSGITINADGTVKNADGTTSTGLTYISDTKFKLSAAVLGTTNVTVDKNNTELSLDTGVLTDETKSSWEDQTEWVDAGRGSYTYETYNKAYYEVKTAVEGTAVKYTVNYNAPTISTAYATVSGLLTGLTNGDIDFDEADNTDYSKGGVLTLNASQLGTGTVKLTTTANATGDFTLALDTENTDETKKVTESTIEANSEEWTTKTTVATLTGLKKEGYTLSEDKKSITYQAGDKTVTLATVKGIKSGAEIVADDVSAEKVDNVETGNKIITLSASQLGTSNVTVTGDGYKLALDDDAVSQTDDAAWVKAANATRATFTQTTYRGFREATDGKSLIYQKNTGNVDLATINGLSKTLTADDMAIVNNAEANGTSGDAIAAQFTAGKLVVVNEATNEIYLAKDALNASAVTLGNADNYKLKLYGADDNGAIGGEPANNDIVYDKSTGTMSIVSGTGAIWKETADGKSLTYNKDTYTTAATITGLPKDLEFDETDDDPLEGITVDGNTITIGKDAVLNGTTSRIANNGNIVLTNYNGSEYTLEVDESNLNAKDAKPTSGDKKQWVASAKNLALKEVTSAYYLKSENTTKHTETITYVAEKVGGDLAVITGLPTGITVGATDGKVYLSDGTTEVIEATSMSDMDTKTLKLKSTFFNYIKTNDADKALTITIAANRTAANQYTFVSADDTDFKGAQEGGKSRGATVNYDTTPTKGTATYQDTKTAGWTRKSDTQITYTTEYGDVLTTFNGLNKTTNYSSNNQAVSIASGTYEATVKAAALTTGNVTVTMPKGATTPYKLTLGSDVVDDSDTNDWKDKTDWAVGGGTATYKTYDKAYYKLQDAAKNPETSPNSIVYVAPTKGTAYASITGLNKNVTSLSTDVSKYDTVAADGEIVITLGATELEGTTKVVLANGGAKTVSAGRNMTETEATALNTKIEAGNTTSAKFKLALDISDSSFNSVTASGIENAVWDNNGKVATLTGTITKGYRLSNDQKTVTYQSADSRLQTIAKVTGIKSGSQISDSNVASLASGATGYNENLPNLQYITLKEEHLSTDNVVLTGEGYKLALDSGVIEATETDKWQNQTEWVNNNGTFVYKTYNKGYYTLDDTTGMRVTYTKPVDDLKSANTQHKTYLTISGLSKTADATVLGAAGTVVESSGTITVTTAGTGVISLSDAALNKQNVKLTDNLNGGYSLSIADSLKSAVSNDSAVISGTKATWTGTQGKGYLLANDDQNITYYSAAKTKQTIATVTGLASTVTSANNDAFSNKYKTATNTVELAAADLGNNVVIGGTAAFKFEDYTEGTVTGSAAADKITFGAGSNTINALGGNDLITVTGGNNTFLYANGNGNDVITGFTAATDGGDILKVTNVVGTTVKTTTNKTTGESTTTYTNNIEVYQDDKIVDDTIVRVNKNYIRLKGVQANNVTVEDKNGDTWNPLYTHTKDGNNITNGSFIEEPSTNSEGDNVFADDNYAMTPNLSSIVKSSTASYSADDLVDDDATSLTKQSTAISYSDKK